MSIYRILTILAIGAAAGAASATDSPERIATYEELTAAGFEVPFQFTNNIKLTHGLLQQAKAEIAAQQRINELLGSIRNRAEAEAAVEELKTLYAVFSTGAQADVVALFVLECYPAAVPMVYAYEDLKLKLRDANCYGSEALQKLLR